MGAEEALHAVHDGGVIAEGAAELLQLIKEEDDAAFGAVFFADGLEAVFKEFVHGGLELAESVDELGAELVAKGGFVAQGELELGELRAEEFVRHFHGFGDADADAFDELESALVEGGLLYIAIAGVLQAVAEGSGEHEEEFGDLERAGEVEVVMGAGVEDAVAVFFECLLEAVELGGFACAAEAGEILNALDFQHGNGAGHDMNRVFPGIGLIKGLVTGIVRGQGPVGAVLKLLLEE